MYKSYKRYSLWFIVAMSTYSYNYLVPLNLLVLTSSQRLAIKEHSMCVVIKVRNLRNKPKLPASGPICTYFYVPKYPLRPKIYFCSNDTRGIINVILLIFML